MGQAHRWLGYVIIFLGVLVNSTGLHEFQRIYVRDAAAKTYIFLNVLAAGAQLFIFELAYQLYNRYSKVELPLDKGTEEWYVLKIKNEAFDKKIKIFVLNNQIFNVALSPGQHQGGKFVFTKNYGRDISKFFYGGTSSCSYKMRYRTATALALPYRLHKWLLGIMRASKIASQS
jgi:hypothetical protein